MNFRTSPNVELHWKERRDLEYLAKRYGNRDVETARQEIKQAHSADAMLAAIIKLVEGQAANIANDALADRSAHPQRLDGMAQAFRCLLEFDLYEISKHRSETGVQS
jgi:ribosomal 50S subunit-associated protein YjgA (DUF615 family)